MGISSNCSTVLVSSLAKIKQLHNGFGLESWKFKQLPNTLGLEKLKKQLIGFDLEFWEVKTTANGVGLASWEVQTTGHWFWSLKIKKLPSNPAFEEFKQLFNTLVLEMSKKQLHCFGRGSWTDQTTSHRFRFRVFRNSTNAKHLWSCLVETTAQRFCSWILGISNKFLMVLVLSHGKFKQLFNCFGFESCEVQTTAQRFLSWILESSTNYQASLSNNCTTVLYLTLAKKSNNWPKFLDSGLEKIKQLTNTFSHGNFKNLPNTFGSRKINQLPYGFVLESWWFQTTAEPIWSGRVQTTTPRV